MSSNSSLGIDDKEIRKKRYTNLQYDSRIYMFRSSFFQANTYHGKPHKTSGLGVDSAHLAIWCMGCQVHSFLFHLRSKGGRAFHLARHNCEFQCHTDQTKGCNENWNERENVNDIYMERLSGNNSAYLAIWYMVCQVGSLLCHLRSKGSRAFHLARHS